MIQCNQTKLGKLKGRSENTIKEYCTDLQSATVTALLGITKGTVTLSSADFARAKILPRYEKMLKMFLVLLL